MIEQFSPEVALGFVSEFVIPGGITQMDQRSPYSFNYNFEAYLKESANGKGNEYDMLHDDNIPVRTSDSLVPFGCVSVRRIQDFIKTSTFHPSHTWYLNRTYLSTFPITGSMCNYSMEASKTIKFSECGSDDIATGIVAEVHRLLTEGACCSPRTFVELCSIFASVAREKKLSRVLKSPDNLSFFSQKKVNSGITWNSVVYETLNRFGEFCEGKESKNRDRFIEGIIYSRSKKHTHKENIQTEFTRVQASVYNPVASLGLSLAIEGNAVNHHPNICDSQLSYGCSSVASLVRLSFTQRVVTEHAVRRTLNYLISCFVPTIREKSFTVRSKWDKGVLCVVVAIPREILVRINILHEIRSRLAPDYKGTAYHLSDLFFSMSKTNETLSLLYDCMCVMFGLDPSLVTFSSDKWNVFMSLISKLGSPSNNNSLFKAIFVSIKQWVTWIPALLTDSNDTYQVSDIKDEKAQKYTDMDIQCIKKCIVSKTTKSIISVDVNLVTRDVMPDYSDMARGQNLYTQTNEIKEGFKKLELLIWPFVKSGSFTEKEASRYEFNRDEIMDRSHRLDNSLPLLLDFTEYSDPSMTSYGYIRSIASSIKRSEYEY